MAVLENFHFWQWLLNTAVVPNLFWCIPPFVHFTTFHSSLLHKFSRVAGKVKTSFLWWVRSLVVGWSAV